MQNMFKEIINQYSFFFDIMDSIDEAVYLCDADGRLLYVNKAAERLDGYTKEELCGRTISDAYGLNAETSPMLWVLRSEKPLKDMSYRYNVNGREIYQICNAQPFFINGKKAGAYTVQKDITHLMEVIERNILFQKEMFLPTNDSEEFGIDRLIGEHPLFRECKEMAKKAAKSESPVLLTGATGSGKELFARCIHENGKRKKGPFLAINCAAIPETLLESILFGTSKGIYTGAVERQGLFEQAEGGTLFLDEINSMSLVSQSKLLRVLEEKEITHLGSKERIKIDVRIISSSNISPQEAISSKQIREDIFYRLAVINIMIPCLADRKSDIFLLVNHFISLYNGRFQKNILALEDEVLGFFLDYSWPGNVRQLKHCIESAMNFVTERDLKISKKHLPSYLFEINANKEKYIQSEYVDISNLRKKLPEGVAQENTGVFSSIFQKEKEQIIKALIENHGNVSKAAKQLGMHRQSLIYRIKKYNIT